MITETTFIFIYSHYIITLINSMVTVGKLCLNMKITVKVHLVQARSIVLKVCVCVEGGRQTPPKKILTSK